VQYDADVGRIGFLPELIDLGHYGVRYLVLQQLESGFPHILRREESQWLGADVVGGVTKLAFRNGGPAPVE